MIEDFTISVKEARTEIEKLTGKRVHITTVYKCIERKKIRARKVPFVGVMISASSLRSFLRG